MISLLRKIRPVRFLFALFFLLAAGYCVWQIWNDSLREKAFVSFTGKTEFLTVEMSATQSQYQWSLSGAYICYGPETRMQKGELVPTDSPMVSNDKLCRGVYGTSDRKQIPLTEDLSLAIVEDTTLEIAIAPPPFNLDDAEFPRGRRPDHILIIRRAEGLSTRAMCGQRRNGVPLVSDGKTRAVELADDAEIHIPVDEQTLMPFAGRISLGQPNSSNTPNLLRSGVVAVYRPINLFGFPSEPQLVRETKLFPGDVLKFEDANRCAVESAGFFKAGEGEDGGFIEVVASIKSKDGRAIVARAAPGTEDDTGRIAIELTLIDAVFSHPLSLLLGFLVTTFVVFKEVVEFVVDENAHPVDPLSIPAWAKGGHAGGDAEPKIALDIGAGEKDE